MAQATSLNWYIVKERTGEGFNWDLVSALIDVSRLVTHSAGF